MYVWQDGILAGLAAVGLASLLWLVFSALRCPRRGPWGPTEAVVRAGDAAVLERTVNCLLRERYDSRGFGRIVLLTDGLDAEARAVAEILARENFAVDLLCAADYGKELAAAVKAEGESSENGEKGPFVDAD